MLSRHPPRPNVLIRGLNHLMPWAGNAESADEVFQAHLGAGIGLSACVLFGLERVGAYVPPDIAPHHGVNTLISVFAGLILVVGTGAVYDRAHHQRRVTLAGTIAELQGTHEELKAMQRQL